MNQKKKEANGSNSSFCLLPSAFTRADWLALGLGQLAVVMMIAVGLRVDPQFCFRDDFQSQYLPGFCEMARAWRGGEYPLLTSLSWQSGALAGEYQYGVFSPVVALCCLILFSTNLPLHLIAAAFVLVALFILVAGCYCLGRSYGLPPALALLVALVGAMNGAIIVWGMTWYPMLHSFAWLPWVWWAARRSLQGGVGPVIAGGVFAALLITAGWPFTVLMMFLVLAFVALQGRLELGLRGAFPMAGIGLIGLGLSAPAWLMLVEYRTWALRVQNVQGFAPDPDLVVPLGGWAGLFFPLHQGIWHTPWGGWVFEPMLALHCGLAPAVILLTALSWRGRAIFREQPAEFAFLALLGILASLPSVAPFRWSFRWLPLFHLTLALVAARLWSSWWQTDQASSPARYCGMVALLSVVALAIYALLIPIGPPQFTTNLALVLLGVGAGWALLEMLSATRPAIRAGLPAGVVVASTCLWILTTPLDWGQVWLYPPDIRDPGKLDPATNAAESRSYLAVYHDEDAGVGQPKPQFAGHFGPGNALMFSGVPVVNGYSPLQPAGTSYLFEFDFHGYLPHRNHLLTTKSTPGPLLSRMAIDGLLVSPKAPKDLSLEEFKLVAQIPHVDVYHRALGPTPVVQVQERVLLAGKPAEVWQIMEEQGKGSPAILERPGAAKGEEVAFGQAVLQLSENSRHRVRVQVDARVNRLHELPGAPFVAGSERPVLVSFARPWFPGYRATWNGVPVAVQRLDTLMPAVELPPGSSGELVLSYRPWSLEVGVRAFSLTALSCLLLGFLGWWRGK